jgi:hypothetical protein
VIALAGAAVVLAIARFAQPRSPAPTTFPEQDAA